MVPTTDHTPMTDTTVNAWTFLPRAIEHWSQNHDEPGLAVAIARVCLALGLGECSREYLDAAPDRERSAPAWREAREQLDACPPAHLDIDTLTATLDANLAARPALADLLRADRAAWRDRLAGQSWYRTTDGNIIIRARDAALRDPTGWLRLHNDREAAAALPLETAPDQSRNAYRVLLDGCCPPWLLLRMVREVYTPGLLGMVTGLRVLQSDPMELLDALAMTDLRDVLGASHVRFHVGRAATAELLDAFQRESHTWGRPIGFTTPGTLHHCSPAIDTVARHIETTLRNDVARLTSVVFARDEQRDASYYARRFATHEAAPNEPLRILMFTSRFTTFVQHSIRDIEAVFRHAGYDTDVLIEDADDEHINRAALLDRLATFDPDLILMVNWMRHHLPVMPSTVPFLTWVQDDSPAYHREPPEPIVTAHLDFVVGCVYDDMIRYGLVRRDHSMQFPVPARAGKFASGAAERSRISPNVLLAMNHGETPEAWLAQRLRTASTSVADLRLFERLGPRLIEMLEPLDDGPIRQRMDDAIDTTLREVGVEITQTIRAQLISSFAEPLVTRILRHRLVEWAVDVCNDNDWTIALCGHGWADHPTYGAYDAGVLRHGDELASAYAASTVTLHASMALMHQRIHECVLSGGLPCVLFKPDDLATVTEIGARAARQRAIESGIDGVVQLGVDAYDDLAALRRTLEALGADHLDDAHHPSLRHAMTIVRASHVYPILATDAAMTAPDFIPPADQIHFIDALRPCMFRNRAELAAVIRRFVEGGDERRATIEHLRTHIERHYTFEQTATAAIDLVRQRLTAAGS